MEEAPPQGERARQIRTNKARLREDLPQAKATIEKLELPIREHMAQHKAEIEKDQLQDWKTPWDLFFEKCKSDFADMEARLTMAAHESPPEPLQGVRTFPSGATRDRDEEKLDPEAFLSPLVIECYCQYMHQCSVQADGTRRSGDNWQKGIPRSAYMKSGWRHFLQVWLLHRKHGNPALLKAALCALLFNVMGYLHEVLVERIRCKSTTV